jgi:hypothetical protein
MMMVIVMENVKVDVSTDLPSTVAMMESCINDLWLLGRMGWA